MKLISCLEASLTHALVCTCYACSSFWTETVDGQLLDVSCELASCYTLVNKVLSCAHRILLPNYWPALWKPLAAALDGALFDAFCHPPSTDESTQLSSAGERQFVADIKTLVAIFAAGSAKALPRSYFRLTREVCHLLEMPAPRLREVCKALDDESAGGLEQLTTILEACGIFTLSPAQVVQLCTTRLDLDGRC
jgi:hypothetical protein